MHYIELGEIKYIKPMDSGKNLGETDVMQRGLECTCVQPREMTQEHRWSPESQRDWDWAGEALFSDPSFGHSPPTLK